MSCAARDWAWSQSGLTPAQRLVLLALAEHADTEGGSCFPSIGTLERMTGLSRRGVTKALEALDGRWIARERGGPGQVTRYRLRIADALPAQQRTPCPRVANTVPADRERSSLDVGNTVATHQGTEFPREHNSLGNSVPMGREPSSLGREPCSLDVGNTVPPNRHKNRQLTVNEPLRRAHARAEPPKEPLGATAAGPIPLTWHPGERVFDWAAKQGLAPDWVRAQVGEFVIYWTDAGTARRSWDATFINRLRDLQAPARRTQNHAPAQPGPVKDYAAGATPTECIPWLDATALG